LSKSYFIGFPRSVLLYLIQRQKRQLFIAENNHQRQPVSYRPCIDRVGKIRQDSKQQRKLSTFTTEAQRSQREPFFVCRGGADRQKSSVLNKSPGSKAREFIENRYLPILNENISLSALRVSNESLFSWGEWAVEIVSNLNSFPLLAIEGGREDVLERRADSVDGKLPVAENLALGQLP